MDYSKKTKCRLETSTELDDVRAILRAVRDIKAEAKNPGTRGSNRVHAILFLVSSIEQRVARLAATIASRALTEASSELDEVREALVGSLN